MQRVERENIIYILECTTVFILAWIHLKLSKAWVYVYSVKKWGASLSFKAFVIAAENFVRQAYYYFLVNFVITKYVYVNEVKWLVTAKMLLIKGGTLFLCPYFFTSCII